MFVEYIKILGCNGCKVVTRLKMMTRVASSNEFSFYDSDYPCIYASQCGIYDPWSVCICELIF